MNSPINESIGVRSGWARALIVLSAIGCAAGFTFYLP